jgi:Undecaprenyl-phosphate galactose phosphotransferase WbaP
MATSAKTLPLVSGRNRNGALTAVPERPLVISRISRRLSSLLEMLVLAISDVTALLLSGAIAYYGWAHLVLEQPLWLYSDLLPLVIAFPLIYAASGLYPGFGHGAPELIRRLTGGTSLGFIILAGAAFIAKIPPEHSRATFGIAWMLSLCALPLMRMLTLSVGQKISWWGEPTVVIGNRFQIELTLGMLSDTKSLGYRVVGAVCSEAEVCGEKIAGVRVLGGNDVVPAVGNSGVSTAIVWGGTRAGLFGRRSAFDRSPGLDWLQRQFRHVVVVNSEAALPVEHVQVRNLGPVLGIEFTNELLRPENRIVKRALDIVLGSIFLVIAAPIIAVAGLLVKLVSRGPMFFVQEREGLDGLKIRMWKLRTMYVDAERRLQEYLDANPSFRSEWDSKCKLERDPRVVRGIGRFLRRFSIDELPQLWCVVRGTMSLVGPRPLPDYHLNVFPRAFRELRRSVRPGVTGLWQIAIRNAGALDEHQRYDSYYIRNWSVWLDVYLLAKTGLAVLSARGAF